MMNFGEDLQINRKKQTSLEKNNEKLNFKSLRKTVMKKLIYATAPLSNLVIDDCPTK